MAEKVAAIRLLQLADTYVLHDRVLVDTHFEFRGGEGRRGTALPQVSQLGRDSRALECEAAVVPVEEGNS
jgi:hypothetical protein